MSQDPTKQHHVVVTGASSGIGLSICEFLIAKGFFVYGSVRKNEDAERLTQMWGSESFMPLLFDVTDREAVFAGAQQVRAQIGPRKLYGLVNNAGTVIAAPLAHIRPEDFQRQIAINLVGPYHVTQALLPLLGMEATRVGRPGRVVQISSVAGKIGTPFVGAYAASKHGLEGFSESLRRELYGFGIDVICIGAGAVTTPIWSKTGAIDAAYLQTSYGEALNKFQSFAIQAGPQGLAPQNVAKIVFKALTLRQPKTRYAAVRRRFRNWTVPSHLPKRTMDKALAKMFGLE